MGRRDDNRALQNLDELIRTLTENREYLEKVLTYGRFSSGQRIHTRGELAEMDGTPAPHYNDPTGDSACWDERRDRIAKTVAAMDKAMGQWVVMAHWMLDTRSAADVAERAKKSVPDCMACGDPVPGRVRSGFDDKCYKRWTRNGRPDRNEFIYVLRMERGQIVDDEKSEPSAG